MLSEEEKNVIDTFKQGYGITDAERRIILNLIEKQQQEINSLKEIEQSHQEENGKLRVELEQEKGKNTELRIQISAEEQVFEDIEEKLDKEKEKNKSLKKQIKEMQEYYKNADFIFKDKIKELLENEIIDISGFRCIAVEDIENLLEEKQNV